MPGRKSINLEKNSPKKHSNRNLQVKNLQAKNRQVTQDQNLLAKVIARIEILNQQKASLQSSQTQEAEEDKAN